MKSLAPHWRYFWFGTGLLVSLLPVEIVAGYVWYIPYHLNPFSAGLFGWMDGLYDFLNGNLPNQGWRLFNALIISILIVYSVVLTVGFWIYRAYFARKLHGDANWANRADIEKAGLLSDSGFLVGRYSGNFLKFTKASFIMLFAPTRSGKGVGLVIPNLLNSENPTVVLDLKTENHYVTSGYRSEVLGHQVYLFCPFAEDKDETKVVNPTPQTHRYNPLSIVRGGVYRVTDILSVGYILWPKVGGKESFWNDQARNLFLTLCLLISDIENQRKKEGGQSELPEYPLTIGEALRQSAGRGSGLALPDYLGHLIKTYNFWSDEFLESASRFLSNSPETLGNIKSSFDAPLSIWQSPLVDAATSASDFNLANLRRQKITIYFGITPNALSEGQVLVNLFFSQLITLNTKTLPEHDVTLKYTCDLLLDECPAVGKIVSIAKGSGFMAGYKLRLILIGQSIAQFEAQDSYGKDDTRSLVANSALQIVFPPKEPKDAKEVSETLGYLTESTASHSRGRGIFNSRSGDSVNVSEQKRALMMPQELRTMPQDKQIVFMEYTKPILCEKIQYYDDPLFIPRVLPPAFVPSIDIAKYQSSLRKMIRTLALADVDLEKKSLKRTSDRDQLEVMTQAPPNRRITPKDAAKELVPFSQFYAKTAGIDFGDLRSKPSPISRKASLDESRQILDGQNLGQGSVLQDFLAQIDAGQDASLISLTKRGVSPFEADAAFEGV